MIIDWIANIFSILGAIEGTRKKVNSLRMNILFEIGNLLGLIYFILTKQSSFILLYSIYLSISFFGIVNNIKQKTKLDKHEKFEIQSGLELIEVIDKINNLIRFIPETDHVIIHPKGHPIVLDDYRRKGFRLYGVIFQKDESTEVFSKRIGSNIKIEVKKT